MEFKLYPTYLDAVLDTNFTLESVDVEGGSPPDEIENVRGVYRLKGFQRTKDSANFIEKAYIKKY